MYNTPAIKKKCYLAEIREGNVLFSICSYEAETEDALNLVEGEKVHVLGK